MPIEIRLHGHHQRRVAGVQHVVEHDDATVADHRRRKIQILGQRRLRVLAIDVDETHLLAAELGEQLARRHLVAVGLPGDALVGRDGVAHAVRLEAVDHLCVRPLEDVDAECALALAK